MHIGKWYLYHTHKIITRQAILIENLQHNFMISGLHFENKFLVPFGVERLIKNKIKYAIISILVDESRHPPSLIIPFSWF